jgi:predicted DNA-binding transcriptional regulator YafY
MSPKKRSGRKRSAHVTMSMLDEILRLLPDHPAKISTQDVAMRLKEEGFEVSKRTVQRSLVKLANTRPIEWIEHEDGHYAWGWQAHALKLAIDKEFTGHQALAFTLIRQFLEKLLPVSTLDVLKPYFDTADKKLQLLSNNPHSAGMPAWASKIRVVHPAQSLIPPTIDPSVQRTVYEALLRDRQLRIAYQKRDADEPEAYRVNPLGLVQRGPVLVLVSTRSDEEVPKNRLMHRISAAQIMNERASRPADFDLDRYIAEGKLGATAIGRGPIKLVARFSNRAAKNLLESPVSEDQIARSLDGDRVEITATLAATDQLVRWLLGYGADVEVLEPVALRSQIASIVAAMSRIYPAS